MLIFVLAVFYWRPSPSAVGHHGRSWTGASVASRPLQSASGPLWSSITAENDKAPRSSRAKDLRAPRGALINISELRY